MEKSAILRKHKALNNRKLWHVCCLTQPGAGVIHGKMTVTQRQSALVLHVRAIQELLWVAQGENAAALHIYRLDR